MTRPRPPAPPPWEATLALARPEERRRPLMTAGTWVRDLLRTDPAFAALDLPAVRGVDVALSGLLLEQILARQAGPALALSGVQPTGSFSRWIDTP